MRGYGLCHGFSMAMLLGTAMILAAGCDALFGRLTDCTPGEPLHPYYEGAICDDGNVVCPDGRTPCEYLSVIDGKDVFVAGCLKECIECPVGNGICYFDNPDTGRLDYVCVRNESECFGSRGYWDFPHALDACPNASRACVKGH